MSSIQCAAIRPAIHSHSQSTVKREVVTWLNGSGRELERSIRAFDTALVARRTSAVPLETVFRKRGFEESNDLYKQYSVEMATAACMECLESAGVEAVDVDCIISTSCTGFMIPSVDAHVAHRLGMKPSLRRLPITEHGCAAGAVALSQAHDYLVAHPSHTALVVAVELPSLTFQTEDKSACNVISSSIFGDGAAAVLLRGQPLPGQPRIVRTASHQFTDSLEWMGFDLKDSGLHIVLSKKVPSRIREESRAIIDKFLAETNLTLADVDHFLLHPGGRRIIEAFEETLGLTHGELAVTRQVLSEHGNLSSATVLYILNEYLARALGKPGELGLMMAFGPGFSAELLLLQWQ